MMQDRLLTRQVQRQAKKISAVVSKQADVWDETAKNEFDPDKIPSARIAEVEQMRRIGVYQEATETECLRDGWTPRLVRWVDTNIGDEQTEQSRSRAVLQETRTRGASGENGDLTSTFAVFPFSEALKAMTSMCMSQKEF